ncbi:MULTISPECIES: nucleoside/nucleotide kinase family protein [Rhodococcus]|uniref:nucleoside/nucleotide kinase family protein n=1 Tax=Rhodococcus TaxID=1827 RepID=UPI0004751A70|nr:MULTISPECIES: nucleoside/nucleotide kinase family protein [Rhodococcus]MCR8692494.1 nucleoside/nucleotide kinase family protein [Rhodococcus pyridinivorans]MXQ74633.1 nucleoside/nucleotide kinase family protein [Rhodococcus rhodochrous]OWY82416.1 nucleoside/nucleotide kinase family protein [Rhodococcus sp. BUPNP1]
MGGDGSVREAPLRVLVDELVTHVLVGLPADRRTVVGLCGPPGAGKSRAAALLVYALRCAGVSTGQVPMDGYHLSNRQLDTFGARDRKGAPDTFDVAGFRDMLSRVRQCRDETIYAPDFSRPLDEPIAAVHAVPADARVIVTEGNYLMFETGGWEHIRPLLDLVIYIDTPRRTLTRRLVRRHRHHGRDDDGAREWVRTVDLPNAEAVQRTRSRADLVWRPVP